MPVQFRYALLFCFVAFVGIACGQDTKTQTPDSTKTAKVDNTPSQLNAAHILIQHKESERAGNKITRTKDEAQKFATDLAKQARAKGADFAALAKKYSDGPSGPDGGDLGNFAPAQMVAAFSKATLKLKIGEVSEPVESDFGYHIILRKKLQEDLNAAHILIQFVGSSQAGESIKRTKEEALALAKELTAKARLKNADFGELAKEHSDGPSGPEGGNLGVFAPGRMVKEFSTATEKLKIGAVSDPVESPFGYHVILRKPLPRKVSARHVLIQYKGSSRADASITRTKEEAKVRIDEVVAKSKDGTKFEDLAKQYSDGPSAPRGGDLGEFPEGAMHPKFNDAVFALEVGATSGVVETPFGFHIIQRYK